MKQLLNVFSDLCHKSAKTTLAFPYECQKCKTTKCLSIKLQISVFMVGD